MIETIIDVEGNREPFDLNKLHHWVKESVGNVGSKDWMQIAKETVSDMDKEVTVHQLMGSLIDRLLSRDTWSYYKMAGRLLAMQIRQEVFQRKSIPTVKEVQENLYQAGLMRRLNYSDYEWSIIEKTINHDLDHDAPHYALEQVRYKYSLRDHKTKKEFETQQFVYMRMAMALFEKMDETDPSVSLDNPIHRKRSRLENVLRIYDHFSKKRLSSPTPNYNNLGTNHRGYASCCLVAAGDNRWSLSVADHITYIMTTQSAGQGLNIMCRSIGDAVQGGLFLHRGKKPYIDVFGKNINANLQGGRGGAGTFYASIYDPEAKGIFGLRDTRAIDTKRNRDCFYAYLSNRYLMHKVNMEEPVFSWNIYTAPKLHQLFYSDDIAGFQAEYERLEQDPTFKKTYFDARELLLFALIQGVGTGTIFAASIDEMNRNTPFIDAIRSSNLCVAPETTILTSKGHKVISTLVDQTVEIWNGEEWSEVKVVKTGTNQKLVNVVLSNGKRLSCTEYHKWYIYDHDTGLVVERRTHELYYDDILINQRIGPDRLDDKATVVSIDDEGRYDDTYCVTEPKRHMAVFNGILTGQCLEISEPTEPYNSMPDLYANTEIGHAKFIAKDTTGKLITYLTKASDVLKPSMGNKWVAQDVKVGNCFWTETDGAMVVTEVISVKREPEVALCSLAAVNLTDSIETDELYLDVMYYAYKMIDYCIMENEFVLPHMGVTAKARMNAGVGMMGLATHMARKRLLYTDVEGLQELHKVAERHMYHAIRASLLISQERGNAPWIHRTKWPEGWTPLETYRRSVDDIADFTLQYDWSKETGIAKEIMENGGIAHSVLVTYMPGESSSKALHATNSIYAMRKAVMIKTDSNNVLRWAAPYSDDDTYLYDSLWNHSLIQQNNLYAIFQKFTDQSISADWNIDFRNRIYITSSELLEAEYDRVNKGMKTRYYMNVLLAETDDSMKVSKSVHEVLAKKTYSEGMQQVYQRYVQDKQFTGDIVDFALQFSLHEEWISTVNHELNVNIDELRSESIRIRVIEDTSTTGIQGSKPLSNSFDGMDFQFEDPNDREYCEGCSV